MPGRTQEYGSAGGSLGATVEVAELEALAKGVLIVGDGSGAPSTLSPGTNGLPLVADSAEATGLKYAALTVAGGGTGVATLTGLVKGNGTSAFSAAVAKTDYAPATSGSAILKGDGLGGFSAASSGTDYAPATSGTAILKGNGSGGFSAASSGTDYAPATSGTAILKGNGSGGFSAASAGTDYYAPSGTDVAVADGGTGASTAAGARTNLGCDDLYRNSINTRQRCYRSPNLIPSSTITLADGTAYWVYLGYTTEAVVIQYVEFHIPTTGGTGAQTAEVGLFSTPNPPNKGGLTFTKIESTGTVDDLTTTGLKRNTSPFTTSIPAGTHVWAGIRTAMATNEPQIVGLVHDMSQGHVQILAGSGALTGAGTWAGGVPTLGITPVAPNLTAVLD